MQKRSEDFSDIKIAFKEKYDSFLLECPVEVSETYINTIKNDQSLMNLLSKEPMFLGDGVFMEFKREVKKVKVKSGKKIDLNSVVLFSIYLVLALFIFAIGSLFGSEDQPDPTPSKSIIVQDHIIPRECFITYSKTEIGYYVNIYDINSDFQVYIEVEDYQEFLNEYLTKR